MSERPPKLKKTEREREIRLTPDGAVAKVVKLLIDYYGIVSL